jgi:D-psicose/D-tagatose/L-ribulose 3-epimerase
MKFGAHAFLWIADWTAESGKEAIFAAADAGFDFIEIPLLRPERFDPARHRRELAEAGIGATASTVLPPHAHMAHRPEEARRFLMSALQRLEELGETTLCGCIAYALGVFTGRPPTEEERRIVTDVLGEVAEEAGRRGINLGFEVCNRYETYMYNTLASGTEALLAIGRENVFLHGDTYHMNIEEEGYYEPLVAAGKRLRYMHMSESHRGLVGSGTVDWEQVFEGLGAARYQGPLVLESFAAINEDLQGATKLWRPPGQPPEVLAREGLAFLRDHAARAGLTS